MDLASLEIILQYVWTSLDDGEVCVLDNVPKLRDKDGLRVIKHVLPSIDDDQLIRLIDGARVKTWLRCLPRDRRASIVKMLMENESLRCSIEQKLDILGWRKTFPKSLNVFRAALPFHRHPRVRGAVTPFWTERIREALEKEDWLLAWRLLKKALNGFLVEKTDTVDGKIMEYFEVTRKRRFEDFGHGLHVRRQADRIALVRMVFDAMRASGVMHQLEEIDFRTRTFEIDYRRDNSFAVSGTTGKLVPGLKEAAFFFSRKDPMWIYFSEEGAMILKIARFAVSVCTL